MKDYLFEIIDGENEGERFFVEAETKQKAWQIIEQNFWGERIEYVCTYEPEEADILGYDTY